MKWAVLWLFATITTVLAENYTNYGTMPPGMSFIVSSNGNAHISAYYFLNTPGNQLHITTAPTINQLKTAEKHKVYQDASMEKDSSVWAPEIHNLGGKWYIYYTHAELSYVVTGGSHPLDPYSNPIKLYDGYGIDGTVLNVKNQPYYVWSCRRPLPDTGGNEQSICISKLTTPTKIDVANIGVISQPMEAWERDKRPLNEGPTPLYWAGETYLMFSGSFCESPKYSLGIMHLTGPDPLSPNSWTKTPGSVFSPANGLYSTGHNGIFTSPDGTELWNTFHASRKPEGSCGTDRETYVIKVDTSRFAQEGPKFGQVQQPGPTLQGPSGEDESRNSTAGGQPSANQTVVQPSANVSSTGIGTSSNLGSLSSAAFSSSLIGTTVVRPSPSANTVSVAGSGSPDNSSRPTCINVGPARRGRPFAPLGPCPQSNVAV